MTLAGPVEPPFDSRVLGAWLRQARGGDVFEYHRGLLTVDRGQLPSEAARNALDRLADLAWHLAAEGRVHLLQRRLAPGAFSYLAVARAQTARHASLPQHLEVAR
jgi:hypothetical protein